MRKYDLSQTYTEITTTTTTTTTYEKIRFIPNLHRDYYYYYYQYINNNNSFPQLFTYRKNSLITNSKQELILK